MWGPGGFRSLRLGENLYLITAREIGPPLEVTFTPRGNLTVDATNVDVRELLRAVAATIGQNRVPDPSVSGSVTLHLEDVPIDEALSLLAIATGLTPRRTANALIFQKRDPSQPQRPLPIVGRPSERVSLDVINANLAEVLQALAAQSGINVFTTAPLSDKVTVAFESLPLEEALELVLTGTRYAHARVGEHYLVGDPTDLTAPGAEHFVQTEIVPLKHLQPEEVSSLLSPLVPNTNLKPLKDQNAVSLTGTEEMLARAREEIERLDQPTPQVMIEALVVEVTDSASLSNGFSLRWQDGGVNLNAPAGQLGYSSVGALTPEFITTLTALVNEGKARVLANPRIATMNGVQAQINIGEMRYFQSGGWPTGDSGESSPTLWPGYYPRLQQVQAGITLDITPTVGAEGDITLEVNPQVDDITGTGPQGLPEVSQRQAQTTIRVRDGETVVIGGLRHRQQTSSVSKRPTCWRNR